MGENPSTPAADRNGEVITEVTTAAAEFDSDPLIGVIVIMGSENAFAAGADIKERPGEADLSFADVFVA
jgi:enoyl-CoA hydratase